MRQENANTTRVSEPAVKTTTRSNDCRRCRLCGEPLQSKRAKKFCCDSHRVEASRLRRILGGDTVDGYETFADRVAAVRAEQNGHWRDYTRTLARESALVEQIRDAFDAIEVSMPGDDA